MTSFKKMILVDHEDDELMKTSGSGSAKLGFHKTFDIRNNYNYGENTRGNNSVHKKSSKIELIEKQMYAIEGQIQKLIKKKKMRDDDKIMYVMGLLKRYSELIDLKKSQVLIDNRRFIEQVHRPVPPSDLLKESDGSTLSDIQARVNDIKSILKQSPANNSTIQTTPLRTLFNRGEVNINPRHLAINDYDEEDEDSESFYENANSSEPMDVDTSVLARFIPHFETESNPLLKLENLNNSPLPSSSKKHRGTKRRANTPLLQSVTKNKSSKVPKLSGIIKKWDLRATEARQKANENQTLLVPRKKKQT